MSAKKALQKKLSEQIRTGGRCLASAMLRGAAIGGAQGLALGIMLMVGPSGLGAIAIPAGGATGAAAGAIVLGAISILVSTAQAMRIIFNGEFDSPQSAGEYEIEATPCA